MHESHFVFMISLIDVINCKIACCSLTNISFNQFFKCWDVKYFILVSIFNEKNVQVSHVWLVIVYVF